jgi:integrase
MQDRYWLYARRNGVYYVQDRVTGRQESLKTKNRSKAKQLLMAKNQAAEQPMLSTEVAKAHLKFKSPEMFKRTWRDVMANMEAEYQGSTLKRWRKVIKSKPFQILNNIPLLNTEASHFLEVLGHPRAGNSTNKWLRILHNRALNLGWIFNPVLVPKLWPRIREKKGRAITKEEHLRLLSMEEDPEWKLFYQMLWETGGSQTDVANLRRENVDEVRNRLIYQRSKLRHTSNGQAALVIGSNMQELLKQLPDIGWFFPRLHEQTESVRSSRFAKQCKKTGLKGVSLHSYRYAWAQRAQMAGMPMREAMAHLGHSSRAIHQAYSDKAEVVTLPLEFYENQWREKLQNFLK